MLPDGTAPLSRDAAETAFAAILDGAASPDAVRAFLAALTTRDETAEEIAAAARAMRARMLGVVAPEAAIDVCGTGGDGQHSLNISTAVSIVVAAAGVPMAKHGNRAASSKAGAADTLEALGVRLDRTAGESEALLGEIGIAFFFAPAHHPALGALASIRRAIGRRTIFNLLGPLANPARVRRQLIGLARPDYVPTYAAAAAELGYRRALIASGEEGLDEISIAGPSRLAWVEGRTVREDRVSPEDAGLPRHPLDAIRGGDASHNAAALRRLLAGEAGAYRDAVLLNAAGALMVAGAVDGWREGVEEAAEVIDRGLAKALLDCWIAHP